MDIGFAGHTHGVTGFLARARRVVNRHGLGGTARLILQQVRPHETAQTWYRLDVRADDRPRRELEETLVLRRGTPEDVDLVAQLPYDASVSSLTAEGVRSRIADGAQLWLVTEGDRTAFACWIYLGWGPVPGANNDGARLPADTAMLEDSIASPDFRGRSVAPGAWTGIADRLKAEGLSYMVTKVGLDNAASRRAVEKAGFREVAEMRSETSPLRRRVRVTLTDPHPDHTWLQALERG